MVMLNITKLGVRASLVHAISLRIYLYLSSSQTRKINILDHKSQCSYNITQPGDSSLLTCMKVIHKDAILLTDQLCHT